MKKALETKEIKEIIKEELPRIIQIDDEIQHFIIKITAQFFAGKAETEDHFDRILSKLEKDSEEDRKKWEEQNEKWEKQNEKWEEQNKKWEEWNIRWEEQNKKWNEKWEEQNKKWGEWNIRWEENQKIIRKLIERDDFLEHKQIQTIGALGARWGLHSEASFRNALSGILEDSFNVQVMHVNEFDDKGEVFGRPDQVELDIIIKNGILILCEIKSSISKSEVYTFNRKVCYYEKRHATKANRKIIVSPMVEEKGLPLAKELGIEVYTFAEDVKESG